MQSLESNKIINSQIRQSLQINYKNVFELQYKNPLQFYVQIKNNESGYYENNINNQITPGERINKQFKHYKILIKINNEMQMQIINQLNNLQFNNRFIVLMINSHCQLIGYIFKSTNNKQINNSKYKLFFCQNGLLEQVINNTNQNLV
ncbi:unnamed protein product [Paramecium sonneborni]|uniref:Uncharacterized protein n=1 Tax=Paramecium sonneborni TaxID=65129 RepID=A0A8S1RRC9_9CILI|nr:unnamed protein product [Paramecium sonneborni]